MAKKVSLIHLICIFSAQMLFHYLFFCLCKKLEYFRNLKIQVETHFKLFCQSYIFIIPSLSKLSKTKTWGSFQYLQQRSIDRQIFTFTLLLLPNICPRLHKQTKDQVPNATLSLLFLLIKRTITADHNKVPGRLLVDIAPSAHSFQGKLLRDQGKKILFSCRLNWLHLRAPATTVGTSL